MATRLTDSINTSAEIAEAAALPCGGAVPCDPDTPPSAELQPRPPALSRQPVEEKSEAQWAYERLILYIRNFESQLDARHEIAMGFAGGEAGILRIEGLGYFDPDIVTFYGQDEDGQKMQLVQHVTQLNVALRAVPRAQPEEPARRIGFRLSREWDEQEGNIAPPDAGTDPAGA